MAVQKLSVSLEENLAKKVRKAARKTKTSVSAWLAGAAGHQLLIDDAKQSIAEWEASNGSITRKELEEIAAKWPE